MCVMWCVGGQCFFIVINIIFVEKWLIDYVFSNQYLGNCIGQCVIGVRVNGQLFIFMFGSSVVIMWIDDDYVCV